MQVICGEPPIYEEAKKLFGLDEKTTTFFAYGDCCYSPSGVAPTAELIAHEETHLEQQGHDRTLAAIWWQRFLIDPAWRIEQEAEAYGAQYRFFCGRNKDRNWRAKYLIGIAYQLASSMYGSAITQSDAIKKIRDYSENKDLLNIEDALVDKNPLDITL